MATFKKGETIFTPRDDSAVTALLESTAIPAQSNAADKAAPVFESKLSAEKNTPSPPSVDFGATAAASPPAPKVSVDDAPLFSDFSDAAEAPAFAAQLQQASPLDYRPRQKRKFIKPWGYVGYFLLFSIPLVGLICAIVFACTGSNRNRRNFARGWLLTLLVFLLLAAAVGAGVYYLYLKPVLDGGGTLTGFLMQSAGVGGMTSNPLPAVLGGLFSL